MELNKTFKDGLWSKEINVRDFVSNNITPYEGDASFLQGPTERTKAVWNHCLKALEEERNKYLISWISYFLVSNSLEKLLTFHPRYKDPITRSIFSNRGNVFKNRAEFKLFVGCKAVAKKTTMLQHLEVFNPPGVI